MKGFQSPVSHGRARHSPTVEIGTVIDQEGNPQKYEISRQALRYLAILRIQNDQKRLMEVMAQVPDGEEKLGMQYACVLLAIESGFDQRDVLSTFRKVEKLIDPKSSQIASLVLGEVHRLMDVLQMPNKAIT